jgi:Putative Actinobacterial Holin-X, holin superfamily III
MVFGRIRRVHGTLKFIHSRTPDYIRLARQDAGAFRREMIEVLVGLGMGAAAGMFFLCFLSVAVIVTAWDSQYRVLTAWLVCSGWGMLAMAGLVYSRRMLRGPVPFENLARALLHDLQVIEAQQAVQ